MRIFFSGIGGAGIGPLALIAKQAGHEVLGSDKQASDYIDYLKKKGIDQISIGQSSETLASLHAQKPIDWLVYSSAVAIENPDSPELRFCKEHDIKATKRDELLNHLISEKNLKLIAVAGTHGKTTTTAMIVWLFKSLGIPISYAVPAKLLFGEMGEFDSASEYFVYEADEFDRNFLAFSPYMATISGIDYDHPDIFPTREEYNQAFNQFIDKSKWSILWQEDAAKLEVQPTNEHLIWKPEDTPLKDISLTGEVNRRDAWLAIDTLWELKLAEKDKLIELINKFPGLSRRFEQIVPGLFSDYAHTPAKIRGALQTAKEQAGDNVVVVYEGLHNTRQHFIKDELTHLFDDVKKIYVVPSYLAREDPSLKTLEPQDIVNLLSKPQKASAAALDDELKKAIDTHLSHGDLVVCLSAGGGSSLDEWIRTKY